MLYMKHCQGQNVKVTGSRDVVAQKHRIHLVNITR